MATAVRGCGERQAGGAYIVAHLGPGGMPADYFLIDEPAVMDVESIGITAIGTTILPVVNHREERTHYVYDIVGREHYPNVADFIEEVRRFGLSRRIAKNIDFSLLDANSRIVLLHERGSIENAALYQGVRNDERGKWCPRDIARHIEPSYDGMCAALFWEDVEGGVDASDDDAPSGRLLYGTSMKNDQPGMQMHIRRADPRAVVRAMPSFAYRALRRPDGVVPAYRHAAFMSFPIRAIEVVRDPAGGSHTTTVEKAKRARGISIAEVDE